jgi:hypothetical protein
MSTSVKNTIVTLTAFTLVFIGYYLYVQNKSSVLQISSEGELTDEMLANARAFIGHSVTLGSIALDTEIFNNPVFRSYQSFTAPIVEIPQGRTNPFMEADFAEEITVE